MQIPKGMDGPLKGETSVRCRASRSVKQSKSLLQMRKHISMFSSIEYSSIFAHHLSG